MNKFYKIAGIVAIAASFAIFAPTAGAAPVGGHYAVHTCNPNSYGMGLDGYDWGGTPVYYMTGIRDCPNQGLSFLTASNHPSVPATSAMSWTYSTGSQTTIEFVRMKISGGDSTDGIEYSMAACDGCMPFASLPARGPSDDPVIFEAVIPSTTQLVLRADCAPQLTQPTCVQSRALKINQIELELADGAPPALVSFSAADDSSDPLQRWFNPTRTPIQFFLADVETGVRTASLQIDESRTLWTAAPHCDQPELELFLRGVLCDPSAGYSGLLDLRALADGVHQLQFNATDALDQAMPVEQRTIKIDTTAPAPPIVSFIDGLNANSWNSSGQIDLHIDDPALQPANAAIGAPPVAVGYTLEPLPIGSGPKSEHPDVDFRSAVPVTIPGEGRWRVSVWTVDEAGNRSDRTSTDFGFDKDVPQPPEPAAASWFTHAQLIAGAKFEWPAPVAQSTLESGVCGYSYSLDAEALTIPLEEANLPAGARSAPIPAGTVNGRHWAHVRAISCAGIASSTAHIAVNVDGQVPTARIFGLPPGEWAREPVELVVSGADALSGVDHVFNSIDAGPRTNTPGDSGEVLVGEGIHAIKFGAVDVAGNESDPQAATVKVDSTPPVVKLAPRDPAAPQRTTAVITDAGSGVASARIMIRRTDPAAIPAQAAWSTLGVNGQASDTERSSFTLSRDIPDGDLDAGTYELRVIATDLAGNTASGGDPVGGDIALELPLRSTPSLDVQVATFKQSCVAGKKPKCRPKPTVDLVGASSDRLLPFGKRIAVVGQLLDPNGDPIANALIHVFATPDFQAKEPLGDLTTDSDGRYELRASAASSRQFEVAYDGSAFRRPQSQIADLRVRAGLTLNLSRARIRNGMDLTLSGKLLSGSTGLAKLGKLIDIEYWDGEHWRPTIGRPRTTLTGSFRTTWTPRGIKPGSSVFFRARVQADDFWPFETGNSKPVRLRIVR
jgi:hypothetical protein